MEEISITDTNLHKEKIKKITTDQAFGRHLLNCQSMTRAFLYVSLQD